MTRKFEVTGHFQTINTKQQDNLTVLKKLLNWKVKEKKKAIVHFGSIKKWGSIMNLYMHIKNILAGSLLGYLKN